MTNLFINGVKFQFEKMVQYETENPNIKECFFFIKGDLVTSQFLNIFDIKMLTKNLI